jgi:hypothetical protein
MRHHGTFSSQKCPELSTYRTRRALFGNAMSMTFHSRKSSPMSTCRTRPRCRVSGTGRPKPHHHFGVWSGNATSQNFLFVKMSRIIHLPDQTRLIRQRYAGDTQWAKKFTDVHLPDQTPMLLFALLRLRTTDPSHFNG